MALTSDNTLTRFGRILIDPMIFLLSIMIAFVILLDAVGSNILHLFSMVDVTNSQSSLSETLTAVIPLSIISILTIVASAVRALHTSHSGKVTGYQKPFNDPGFFLLLFFLAVPLFVCLVLQILELKNLVNQTVPIQGDRYKIIATSVFTTVCLATVVSFSLSYRDVVTGDIVNSVAGSSNG